MICVKKFVMKNVHAQREGIVRHIVNATQFYANLHIMDAIVPKGTVPQIIVLVL